MAHMHGVPGRSPLPNMQRLAQSYQESGVMWKLVLAECMCLATDGRPRAKLTISLHQSDYKGPTNPLPCRARLGL